MNMPDNNYPGVPATQSSGWAAFTYIAFAASLFTADAGGIFLPIETCMPGSLP